MSSCTARSWSTWAFSLKVDTFTWASIAQEELDGAVLVALTFLIEVVITDFAVTFGHDNVGKIAEIFYLLLKSSDQLHDNKSFNKS